LEGAGLLIAALVYLYGAFQAADLVNTNPEKGNQMAYLLYGDRLWESGYTFKGDRNRMPALPVILPVTYQKGWRLEDDFFPERRPSACCSPYFAWWWWARRLVSRWAAPRAWYSRWFWPLLCTFTARPMCRRRCCNTPVPGWCSSARWRSCGDPSGGGAVALGVVMGLTYLTKASILPAVGLAAVLLAAR
jgi:hypothetical protein